MKEFSKIEAAVLNRIQLDFPINRRPFETISRELSMSERQLLSIISDLKARGIIRNISAIFNSDRLGYSSSLVAFKVPEHDIENAVLAVNAHPGVSHNYLRDHAYNLWFTIAADSPHRLESAVSVLSGRAHAVDHLILTTERLLKIGVHFAIGDGAVSQGGGGVSGGRHTTFPLSDVKREAVRLLQCDLPIEPEPFASLIARERSSIDYDSLIDNCIEFKREGVLRRYSAVLRHRKAGYRANAMTAWRPAADGKIDMITAPFMISTAVSHLYLRRAHGKVWDYPLFAMIHAPDETLLDSTIDDLARQSGMNDYLTLHSLREYKKERVTYFSNTFKEWEIEAGI